MNDVMLKVNGTIYMSEYVKLGQTAKTVISGLLKHMNNDTNLFYVGGDTLKKLVAHTGYSDATIRNQVSKIVKTNLIEHTSLRGEYIVNPLFAVKGDEKLVWKSYERIEIELHKDKILL